MFRRRYIFIFLALLAVVVVGISLSENRREQLRTGALWTAGPLLKGANGIGAFFSKVDEGIQTLEQAQNEARRLLSENAQLGAENQVLQHLKEENARLREMLGFKQQSSFKLLPCKMIARDPSTWWSVIQVDRGWKDAQDLRPDLPVVSPRGVIGKTGTVSEHVTEVILMVDGNCKIAALVENSREAGIVIGEGGWQERPRARMKYVNKNAALNVGERIFTSGLGGVFPAGLAIGSIVEVPPAGSGASFGLYREALIEPAVDLTHLDELFIISGVQ